MVGHFLSICHFNFQPQDLMDAIKAAGWTRFKPVKGQPIAEQDMRKVFNLVDMDKSGAISQLVGYQYF